MSWRKSPRLKTYKTVLGEGSGKRRWEGVFSVEASSEAQAKRKFKTYADRHGLKPKK